jgi:four helix bundle protein
MPQVSGVAMTPEEMKKRTRDFALRCIRMAQSFRRSPAGDVIARQLIRSATSVGANYRSACLARSRAEFVAKLGVVQEEADESVFWIDLAPDAGLVNRKRVRSLLEEGEQVFRIIATSLKTAKRRRREGAEP